MSPHNLFFLMVPQHRKFRLHSSSCLERKITVSPLSLKISWFSVMSYHPTHQWSCRRYLQSLQEHKQTSLPSLPPLSKLSSSLPWTTEGASLLVFHPCLLSSHSEPFKTILPLLCLQQLPISYREKNPSLPLLKELCDPQSCTLTSPPVTLLSLIRLSVTTWDKTVFSSVVRV